MDLACCHLWNVALMRELIFLQVMNPLKLESRKLYVGVASSFANEVGGIVFTTQLVSQKLQSAFHINIISFYGK